MKTIQLTILLLAYLMATTVGAQEKRISSIEVAVQGIKKARGTLYVFLFDSERSFLSETYKTSKTAISSTGQAWVTFTEIPEGAYAINAYHDVNGNDRLDTNWMRIPREPYGFSNKARGKMGPPTFSQAKFHLGNRVKRVKIFIQ